MKQEDFRSRLKPFDDLYTEMRKEIRKRLEVMTEAELKQIKIDTCASGPTNCAWTTYDVAKIVRDIADWVEGIDTLPQAIKATEPHSNVVAEADKG